MLWFALCTHVFSPCLFGHKRVKCASTAPPQHFNSVLLRTELCQLSRTGSRSLSVSTEEPSSCGDQLGEKRLSDPGAQLFGSHPITILPKPFSSLISLIWCWPFSSIHFPWNRSHTLMGIAHTPPPSSTLHDLAYFGHWSRRTDRMLPVGKNRIGVFFVLFFSSFSSLIIVSWIEAFFQSCLFYSNSL